MDRKLSKSEFKSLFLKDQASRKVRKENKNPSIKSSVTYGERSTYESTYYCNEKM